MGDIRARRLAGERIAFGELHNIACPTNHDLAFEGQFAGKGRAQGGIGDFFAYHESADRADVDYPKLGQLLRDVRWAASVRCADVHRTQEYDRRHREPKLRSYLL